MACRAALSKPRRISYQKESVPSFNEFDLGARSEGLDKWIERERVFAACGKKDLFARDREKQKPSWLSECTRDDNPEKLLRMEERTRRFIVERDISPESSTLMRSPQIALPVGLDRSKVVLHIYPIARIIRTWQCIAVMIGDYRVCCSTAASTSCRLPVILIKEWEGLKALKWKISPTGAEWMVSYVPDIYECFPTYSISVLMNTFTETSAMYFSRKRKIMDLLRMFLVVELILLSRSRVNRGHCQDWTQ